MRDDDLTQVPAGIIAVIRAPSAAEALTIGRGLVAGGVGTLELTLTVPDAVEVIDQLVRDGGARVGAGTVLSPASVTAVGEVGASFVVAPDTDPAVLEAAVARGLVTIPGALTPTEIRRAFLYGATAVKVFPVAAAGGPGYIRAVREPLPDIGLVVSGGISLDDVADYLTAGARAVCLGGALIDRRAAAAGDIDGVAEHCRRALRHLKESKNSA